MKRFLFPVVWTILLFISGKDYLHAGHDHLCNHGQHEQNSSVLVNSYICFACTVVLTTGEIARQPDAFPAVTITPAVRIGQEIVSITPTTCTVLLRGPPVV